MGIAVSPLLVAYAVKNSIPWQIFERHRDAMHQNPLLCIECDRLFGSESEIVKHYKTEHGDNAKPKKSTKPKLPALTLFERKNLEKKAAQTYVCKICLIEFKDPVDAKYHVNHHHPDDPDFKQYTCELCGKSFTVAADYEIHVKRHKGLRPFKCSDCGKTLCRLGDAQPAREHRRVPEPDGDLLRGVR
ncbi:myoneurin-like [Aedes aegypti]|uniref:C2H2-type domain-containing protein n=1 Tax=Aedes aegypti TaxID=7159 RepID=A0A903VTF6_AEDAE|nr:myoneurin-like [Aedes aegypti]